MFNIQRCKTYNEKEVAIALDKLVDLTTYVKKGEKVLLKPNLLDALKPERAVTTHPSIVKAVVKKLQIIGARVIIYDSAQGLFTKTRMQKVYRETGMQQIADETGCELSYDTRTHKISSKSGFLKQVTVASTIDDVDKIINISKVKCHIMAKFTCATKNLYGYVPGLIKSKYHLQTDMGKFAKVLLDLEEYKKPVLTIVDGIIGMEGQGPAGGDPKQLGLLFAGTNVFETDYNICKIIGIKPLEVLYLKRALEEKKFKENEEDFKEYFVKFKEARILMPFFIGTKEYKKN